MKKPTYFTGLKDPMLHAIKVALNTLTISGHRTEMHWAEHKQHLTAAAPDPAVECCLIVVLANLRIRFKTPIEDPTGDQIARFLYNRRLTFWVNLSELNAKSLLSETGLIEPLAGPVRVDDSGVLIVFAAPYGEIIRSLLRGVEGIMLGYSTDEADKLIAKPPSGPTY
jgi:hypothetical protein